MGQLSPDNSQFIWTKNLESPYGTGISRPLDNFGSQKCCMNIFFARKNGFIIIVLNQSCCWEKWVRNNYTPYDLIKSYYWFFR